jgi:hypothetical protein
MLRYNVLACFIVITYLLAVILARKYLLEAPMDPENILGYPPNINKK